jgi:DNA modification methylase
MNEFHLPESLGSSERGGLALRSPKRTTLPKVERSRWYDYYAGYSPKFVRDSLLSLNLRSGSTVLDPWNGSGTTSRVARGLGMNAVGFDINPAMVIIAKSWELSSREYAVAENQLKAVIKRATSFRTRAGTVSDPLSKWLVPSSSETFRCLEQAIQETVLRRKVPVFLVHEAELDGLTGLGALFYTALFRTFRSFLTSFRTTNPTWIKAPALQRRLHPKRDEVFDLFQEKFLESLRLLFSQATLGLNTAGTSHVSLACSKELPVRSNSVDAVVTSPPYCTRIDYVIATRPELAILGFEDGEEIQSLRHKMIGTPTMIRQESRVQIEWGGTCRSFLESVTCHKSKASSTYYTKYFLQYFDSTFKSLKEIDRVLKRNGSCLIVVQDSFYKEIHNNLPKVISEMGVQIGWKLQDQLDFSIPNTIARINSSTSKYRPFSKATESVLVFKKNGGR